MPKDVQHTLLSNFSHKLQDSKPLVYEKGNYAEQCNRKTIISNKALSHTLIQASWLMSF